MIASPCSSLSARALGSLPIGPSRRSSAPMCQWGLKSCAIWRLTSRMPSWTASSESFPLVWFTTEISMEHLPWANAWRGVDSTPRRRSGAGADERAHELDLSRVHHPVRDAHLGEHADGRHVAERPHGDDAVEARGIHRRDELLAA